MAEQENNPTPETEAGVRSRWPEALRSMRYRDFRLFWLGLIISVTGTWMQMTAQGWLVYELTNSPLYLGLVAVCSTLPMLLFSLPGGVLADRMPRRRVLLVTQSLAAGQAAVLAGLVYAGVVEVWHVMVLAGVAGLINAFDMPTRHSMVLDLVEKKDVFNAVSLNASAFNSGRIVGPSAAGVLIATAGMAGCFAINAVSFVPLIFILTIMRPVVVRRAASAGTIWQDIGGAARWVRGHAVALSLLILIGVSSLFAMPYATIMPIFARDIFHTGPRGYGFLMSAPAVGSLVAAMTMTAVGHRARLGAVITMGSFVFPAALMLLGGAPNYGTAVVILFFIGLGMMSFNATSNAMLQKEPPDELRGRVMGLRSFLFAGMGPLGNLQIGAMTEWLGARWTVVINGAICLAAAAVVWRSVPNVRKSE